MIRRYFTVERVGERSTLYWRDAEHAGARYDIAQRAVPGPLWISPGRRSDGTPALVAPAPCLFATVRAWVLILTDASVVDDGPRAYGISDQLSARGGRVRAGRAARLRLPGQPTQHVLLTNPGYAAIGISAAYTYWRCGADRSA